MDDLPELPFEKVLSYLSLEDRLKARAVSRRWYHVINSFKAKSLCFSELPSGFIEAKSRWVSGAFAKNFISSPRFASFFNTFGPTILSNLKHLRLCDLYLDLEQATTFAPTLNSFGQLLEKLDIIRFYLHDLPANSDSKVPVELKLPALHSLQLEDISEVGAWKGNVVLILDAPKLQKVQLFTCGSCLELVHGESVEWLYIIEMGFQMQKLKNLQYLYVKGVYFDDFDGEEIDPTFLSGLGQLKELHLSDEQSLEDLFELERFSGRTDLKIYYHGLLLNGPNDPAVDSLDSGILAQLAENPSRLADEMPFRDFLDYAHIECVDPEVAIDLVNRFTRLRHVCVNNPVEDIDRFLRLLKNVGEFEFRCNQPQELFDLLPEHCAIQVLTFWVAVSDFQFLFRMKHLMRLQLYQSINIELIQKVFQEFKYLFQFDFVYHDKWFLISILFPRGGFKIWDDSFNFLPDLNAVIEFVIESASQKQIA